MVHLKENLYLSILLVLLPPHHYGRSEAEAFFLLELLSTKQIVPIEPVICSVDYPEKLVALSGKKGCCPQMLLDFNEYYSLISIYLHYI